MLNCLYNVELLYMMLNCLYVLNNGIKKHILQNYYFTMYQLISLLFVIFNNNFFLSCFTLTYLLIFSDFQSVIHPFAKLIFTCNKWFRTRKVWMDGAFDALILDKVEEVVEEFNKLVFYVFVFFL